MSEMELIEIDGSYLEGGGQILRNALSLSCILCRPIRIINIRANRPNPGLSNQHLYGLNLLQQITCANVKGNFIGSTEVEFYPGKIKSGNYTLDTTTAASVTLVFQAALPVLLFGDAVSTVEIIGGTNVRSAPQVDYTTEILRGNLEKFGVSFDFDLYRRGYYPRGNGRCKFTIPPVRQINSVNITRFGKLTKICGWCYVAGNIPQPLVLDICEAATEELQELPVKPYIEAYKESAEMAKDNGAGIILKAVTSEDCIIGSSALGEKRIDAYPLGAATGRDLVQYINDETCVDIHAQDQLILFMALAEGRSTIQTVELTNHTLTAIHFAELIAGVNFEVERPTRSHIIVSCTGLGLQNKNLKM